MREIKFRAWDGKDMSSSFTIQNAVEDEAYRSDDPLFLQFTGLKDKNGVEIYEGDVLRVYSNGIFQVYWDNVSARFLTQYIGNGTVTQKSMGYSAAHGTVIGNIYENKELTNG